MTNLGHTKSSKHLFSVPLTQPTIIVLFKGKFQDIGNKIKL